MTDQQRATASHLYGNSFCETPSMQRLADWSVDTEDPPPVPLPEAKHYDLA